MEALDSFGMREPYILAGYSFGGMLAYELARQLHETGRRIADVLIIDTGPEPNYAGGILDRVKKAYLVAQNLPRWTCHKAFKTRSRELHEELWWKLNQVFRRIRSRSQADSASTQKILMEDIWNVSRLTPAERHVSQDRLDAFFRYSPEAYPGQITVFRAAARPLFHSLEPDLGWNKLGGGRVVVEHIPGDHMRILRPPYSQILAARITEVLDRIAAEHDSKQTPQPGDSGE
jgi:thioesterase domain-containing protein